MELAELARGSCKTSFPDLSLPLCHTDTHTHTPPPPPQHQTTYLHPIPAHCFSFHFGVLPDSVPSLHLGPRGLGGGGREGDRPGLSSGLPSKLDP